MSRPGMVLVLARSNDGTERRRDKPENLRINNHFKIIL